jgi:hypothetical protein
MAFVYDSEFASGILKFAAGVLGIIGLAVLILRRRDRAAKSQGKTPQQIRARFDAILQFRSALQRSIPGILIIIFGIFYALDRGRQHDSDWWMGLLFIPVGWVTVPLLARKSWRRYRELQRLADKGTTEYGFTSPEGPPTGTVSVKE